MRCEWLNGKHTVFGRVVEGLKVLDDLEYVGSESGKPKQVCRIVDCGEIKTEKKQPEVKKMVIDKVAEARAKQTLKQASMVEELSDVSSV